MSKHRHAIGPYEYDLTTSQPPLRRLGNPGEKHGRWRKHCMCPHGPLVQDCRQGCKAIMVVNEAEAGTLVKQVGEGLSTMVQ